MRFIRGVIDSNDLPLNVSREILQESRDVEMIRAGSVRRVLSVLEELAENQKEKYATFWKEFGRVFKEGLGEDHGRCEAQGAKRDLAGRGGLVRSCPETSRLRTRRRIMELLSTEFLSALLAIVVIDLVLAGDNAIVIALAARGLPPTHRKRAIVWGTIGAIVVRSAMTMAVVWLLRIPGLLAIGGSLLVWIAWKLIINNNAGEEHALNPAAGFWTAMKTIIVADALMGLDNVLAVAGAAQGSFLLVIMGLLISIPIVIWGSQLILKFVERHPIIVYVGSGVLAWTAVKMVTSEPLLQAYFAAVPGLTAIAYITVIGGVLTAGFLANYASVRARVAQHGDPQGVQVVRPAALVHLSGVCALRELDCFAEIRVRDENGVFVQHHSIIRSVGPRTSKHRARR